MKIQFKVASTAYTVKSPEKQMEIEAYCAKITKRTGRTTHILDGFAKLHSSNPKYVKFYDGMSTAHYVRKYERANAYRFAGSNGTPVSLFDNLSTNPQSAQDDSHIEEPNK